MSHSPVPKDDQWYPNSGGTPAIYQFRPCTADNTQGPGNLGIYMFIEDSSTLPGDINLISPCIDTSTATSPFLTFFQSSGALSGAANDNILDIDVIDVTSGGTLTPSVATILGNGDLDWHPQFVDLNAFAGNIVRVIFRGGNDASSFIDDEAIDDVEFIDLPLPSGQAPQAGLAVFDMNNATNALGMSVAAGGAGPYATTVVPETNLDFSWEGIANLPLSILVGAINPTSATFPGIGQFDIGGPGTDPLTGIPLNLGIFADGIGWAANPVGLPFDAFFFMGPAGTGSLSLLLLNFGLPTGSTLTGFQAVMSDNAAPFFHIANAVELIIG